MPLSIRTFIDKNADGIIENWEADAGKAVASEGLSRAELRNQMPRFLASLLGSEATAHRDVASRRWLVDSHLADRLRRGFELTEMVEEFNILGRCIEATWSGKPDAQCPPAVEIEKMHEEILEAITSAMGIFGENLIQYQQSEKRFLRRLQLVATDSNSPSPVPMQLRLQAMLRVMSDALEAETTGLYLYEPGDEQLRLVASTGIEDDLMNEYVSPRGAPSLASRMTEVRGGIYVADVSKTNLEVPDPIRKKARSILGMPLLPRGALLGALYVGIRESRLFEPREVRLFESLGERFGQLLDDARVHGDLTAINAQLRTERELRERFVAVMAHDLLGPLAAAKMGMQLLLSHPELLAERNSVPARIIQDLDRTDGMVRDMLDVNQIRAGHRLTLRLTKVDLVAVTRDVVQELKLLHGDRFVVKAEEHEWGFWSTRDMRRALWNLASNAIKYGSKETPIEIRIASIAGTVELAVHNEGPAIPAEDRAGLFEPFSRAVTVQAAAQRGWGLGLTLVKGCVEAHGGTVEIESEPGEGTTFTLRFPSDARPFQPRPNASSDA